MQDPRTMHPQELIRGLMRGHHPDFKQGYSAEAAVMAAIDVNEQASEDNRDELLAYAEGFAAGMMEDRELILPAGIDA